jgi:hypothetical protein
LRITNSRPTPATSPLERHHLPPELDDVAEASGVVLRPERELSRRHELLVCAGHSGLQLAVAASLEGWRDVQRRGGRLNLLGRLEYVERVLGPQRGDGATASLRVRLVPDRRVAIGYLP